MLLRVCTALVLIGARPCLTAQTAPIRFISLVGSESPADTCQLAKNNVQLEARLKNLGWKWDGTNFPKIDWGSKIAAVISVSHSHALPKDVGFSEDKRGAFVHLEPNPDQVNGGILVLELDSQSGRVSSCSAVYQGYPRSSNSATSTTGAMPSNRASSRSAAKPASSVSAASKPPQ
jgi:hypothetical protein